MAPPAQGYAFRTFGVSSGSYRSRLYVSSPSHFPGFDESSSYVHEVGWLGAEALNTSPSTYETICVYRLTTPCVRPVATLNGSDLYSPAGSPEATRLAALAYESDASGYSYRVVLFDPVTAAPIRDLTQGPRDYSPSFSPDGTTVSFQRNGDTWAVPADGSAAPRLLVAGLTGAAWGRDPNSDTTAPQTTITAGPSIPTRDSTPTFSFTSSEAGSTFECRVDSVGFAPCTSPRTTAALSEGMHTFRVRARDAAGNIDATPASRTFKVDTIAPQTAITSGPSGSTSDSTPTFAFSAGEGGSRFECRVDNAGFAPCTSPHTTAALTNGTHTFRVRARDAAGNADATPAIRTFTVTP